MKKISTIVIVLLILGGFLYLLKVEKSKQGDKNMAASDVNKNAPKDKILAEKVTQGLSIQIIEPKEGVRIVSNQNFAIKGKAAPYAEVFVADRELRADAQGNFSTILTLDEGENVIVILANDENGNFAEETLIITLQ